MIESNKLLRKEIEQTTEEGQIRDQDCDLELLKQQKTW